ncbi:MAG: hypothetical protein GEU80_06565 [Dehalococcoidia bacterium]|nr:hypothetical protein [Dehalococcoidia bacterium]
MAERPSDRGPAPERPRRPDRGEPPIFAPVIFEDDEDVGRFRGAGGPPGSGDEGDTQLIRVLGVIVLLGIVIAILVLPPISILDRGGGGGGAGPDQGGIIPRARDSVPETPEGLVALSRLYDLEASPDAQGPWTLTVKLTEPTEDGRNLAFYSHDGERWSRVASVTPVEEGSSAQGDIDALPPNLAVLRATQTARTFAAIVPAGQAPADAVASSATAVSVLAAVPALAGEEETTTLQVTQDAFSGVGSSTAAGSELSVYFGVTAGPGDEALGQIFASDDLVSAHVDEIVQAARSAGAGGVHIDYQGIAAEQRAAFTGFIEALSARLSEDDLQLAVTVTTPAAPNVDAYEWSELVNAADALWLRAPVDASTYYNQVEALLTARRDDGVDLGKVSLVLERQSHHRGPDGIQQLPLRDALVRASTVNARLEGGGVGLGEPVTVSGVNIDSEVGNSGLLWDDQARAVAYSYTDQSGPHTVWIENRYSAAFRLDLAARFGLGGVVVADAQADEALPDVWSPVLSYLEVGSVELLQPYGPYLAPCWRTTGGTIEGAGACWEGGSDTGVIVWRAPEEEGVYDVTLVVSDGTVFVGQQFALRVTADGEQVEPTPPAEETAPPATDTPVDEATPEATDEPEATEEPQATEEPTEEPDDDGGAPGDGPPGPAGN